MNIKTEKDMINDSALAGYGSYSLERIAEKIQGHRRDLNPENFPQARELAKKGDLQFVDLTVARNNLAKAAALVLSARALLEGLINDMVEDDSEEF